MKKTILFFSCEPGGAEALIPAVRLLRGEQQASVSVASYGLALNRFRAQHIACEEIAPIQDGDHSVFDRFNPSLIITSATSLPQKDMSEKYLWKNAKARGIKTLAFLDQWQNYALRFSGPSPKEKLTYLPDRINCINETGREEMLAEGFPKELLVPLGQPYLSELKTTAEVLDPSVIRRKWGIPSGRPVVLFVSEPIEDSFAHTRGYSEYSVLDFFISTLWPTVKNGFLVLKLHDKDDPKKYTSSFTRLKPNVLVLGREATPVETIVAADHVYGMTSIMLIQSFILGKNTVSLQPGLISNDPLVLSRKGYIRLVRSKKDIDVPWKPSNPDSFEFAFRKAEFMKMIAALM